MLQQLSEQIRACQERAAEARRQAEETADPDLKAVLLGIERRWLTLARSYEFTDRLDDFTAAMSTTRPQSGPSAGHGLGSDEVLQLQEISTLLIHENDVHALYERVLDAAVSLMSGDMGSMQMLDPERGQLQLLAWRGFHPESAAFWEWVRLDAGCTCGQALSSGARVVVPALRRTKSGQLTWSPRVVGAAKVSCHAARTNALPALYPIWKSVSACRALK